MTLIDGYFAFLEQRYAGEIARRYGLAMEPPVDPFNRPRHRGDFGLRVPPSQRAIGSSSPAGGNHWTRPASRCRPPDYVMAKVTYISGVRAAELCGVRIGDLTGSPGSGAGSWSRQGRPRFRASAAGGLHVR